MATSNFIYTIFNFQIKTVKFSAIYVRQSKTIAELYMKLIISLTLKYCSQLVITWVVVEIKLVFKKLNVHQDSLFEMRHPTFKNIDQEADESQLSRKCVA